MRLIDADMLKAAVIGTTMSAEQRNLFDALIDKHEWYLDAYKKFENRCIPSVESK